MKKSILILQFFISAITFAQTSDWATTLTILNINTVQVHNNQTCATPYKVEYGDTTYTSEVAQPNCNILVHTDGCATVTVTPIINCSPGHVPGPYTLQVCTCGVLPVRFVKLQGQRKQDGSIDINFKVGEQINIKEYRVMISTDGKNFVPKYSIPAKKDLYYNFNFKQ